MKTTHLPKANHCGFTLIEVVIALSVFAIGLLALAGMQSTGIIGNATAHSVTARVAFAEGIIEEFLAMDPDDPKYRSDPNYISDYMTGEIDGAGTLQADVQVVVNPVIGGTPYNGLAQIRVTVTGPDVTKPLEKTVMHRRR